MTIPALCFRSLVKRYDQREILRGISLTVERGEFFGLVGMNGAGKTTLIKCLLDFCAVDDGDIEIFGVGSRNPAARRALSFLPERFLPPYYLTGRDFLACMLDLQGVQVDRESIAAAAAGLDFDGAALSRPVRSYSKGMAQKLGLIAAFLTDRQLHVLDEPMSGLDSKARALVKQRMKDMRARGKTLFFSSHALADVDEICDRMAILHGGALRFVGSPAECRARFQATTLEQAYMKCIEADV